MLTFLELGRDWDALGPFQVGTRGKYNMRAIVHTYAYTYIF